MNTRRYNELAEILDHLYDPAHCDELACTDFLGDHDV